MKAATFESKLGAFYHDLRILVNASLVNILVLVFTYFCFCVPAQAKDLFNEMVVQNGSAIRFWFALTFLSLALWYSTVIALAMHDLTGLGKSKNPGANLDPATEKKYKQIITLVPYGFGLAAYVIACAGFGSDGVAGSSRGFVFLGFGFLVYLGIESIRRWLFRTRRLEHLVSKERVPWSELHNIDKTIILVISAVLGATIVFALIISFNPIKPANIPQGIGTTTLITFYLAGVAVFFSVIWGYVEFQNTKFSLSFVVLIIILIFSNFNNNHHIRLTGETRLDRTPIEENFAAWITGRVDTNVYKENKKFTIFLVAAEGGGVRAMTWAALVLEKLYATNPDFHKHVYAVSGVSGGSAGAVFHYAFQSEMGADALAGYKKALGGEFLSPVTFGLLFPDMVQSIIPYPIDAWDRSRWLEDAWFCAYKSGCGSDKLNYGLCEYANNYKAVLPNIFLNCTAVETGQKVVLSNLKLTKRYFEQDIDLLTTLQETKTTNPGLKTDIPLKTAASISARFPLVTSAGKIALGKTSFQIVDGGYHDNTGLETLNQIFKVILDATPAHLKSRVKVSFVYIKNSENPSVDSVKSTDFLVDLSAPVSTFLNNWNWRTNVTVAQTRDVLTRSTHHGITADLNVFELDRAIFIDEETGARSYDKADLEVLLPLGWQLSEVSKSEIFRQVEAITDSTKFDSQKDPVASRNFENYRQIKRQVE